ncbi:AAA family ATPase [Nonomuraea sp. SMC257]|uniref:AAA family ATPase n=1 Tax=Nonomuraea montanisoli TaxID=2741721 RepID=A0A7Y6M3B2_9ACTN|nr:ATP-binding protein [Nonomuraea montanisoli]NUW32059.1 AAA family ATPase [Nonomuraea montanisoli]
MDVGRAVSLGDTASIQDVAFGGSAPFSGDAAFGGSAPFSRDAVFVGRAAELALLRAELRAAVEGRARVVAVEGPEGIGKTALLHQALAECAEGLDAGTGPRADRGGRAGAGAGMRVLAVSGERGERELPFGLVRQLVRQAAGLDDPWRAGRALAAEIDRLEAEGPLAVLVDDVQWADRSSLLSLGYVLRRLPRGRLLVAVAGRDLGDEWLPEGLRRFLAGDAVRRLALGGLTAADLSALARAAQAEARVTGRAAHAEAGVTGRAAHAEVGLSGRAAERLCAHTGGNPLHARALLATLTPRRLADTGTPLPAPETYTRSFARRLGACDPAARTLVAACAVLGESCDLHMAVAVAAAVRDPAGAQGPRTAPGAPEAAAAGGHRRPLTGGGAPRGGAFEALQKAVEAGVLEEGPGRTVRFASPLAQAAARAWLGAAERARLHEAAARLVEDAGAALRHRAAAAGRPDDALAEELAGLAAKEVQHGQWREAAACLHAAAALSESPARREELRTAVLEHTLLGGDVTRAVELAAEPSADPRPFRRYVLGRLALAAGRLERAGELLADAWREREPAFAADTAEQLAWLNLVRGRLHAAAGWADLAVGQPLQGAAARPYDVLALAGWPRAGMPEDGLAAGVARLRDGDVPGALSVLGGVVAALERAGLPHHRLMAAALLAVAEYRDGRWDEAAARAERALAEARGLGQRWLLPWLGVVCAAVPAARGERERALAHAGAALAAARRMRHARGEAVAGAAMTLLAPMLPAPGAHTPGSLTSGSLTSGALVPRALVPTAGSPTAGSPDMAAAYGDPFAAGLWPLLVERLISEGRLDEAQAELAARGDTRCTGPARARLEGLLLGARNVPAGAEIRLLRALELARVAADPLEEGRALLGLGMVLRRTGRRRAAAERLRTAYELLDRLGARPLAETCARELDACGAHPPGTVRPALTSGAAGAGGEGGQTR